jgi:hypothetical protein
MSGTLVMALPSPILERYLQPYRPLPMTLEQDKIDQLAAFIHRDKFSDKVWNDRGLNPSAPEISSKLAELFNKCADALVDAVRKNATDKQLKSILKSHLANFTKWDYDTEEREFICDLFFELAQIVEVDLADNVNRWLYGWTMNALFKFQTAFNPRKVLDTIKQNCLTCGGAIDTFIMQRVEGIPDYSWNIVQCKSCKDFSLVTYGPNVKEVKFGNYDLVEQLPKDHFTKEQAEIRLEQVRHFRK